MKDRIRAWQGEALLGMLWVLRLACRLPPLRRSYLALAEQLVARTGLFDPGYYLGVNSDVAAAGMKPLRHYVLAGDREGRSPLPVFDPSFYRSQATGKLTRVNALLHYVYVGRYRKTSPSPWFDLAYYLRNNKDIARSGIEPLYHYLHWGGAEGRSPCAQFDSVSYLQANPVVAKAGINPLLHYLQVGRLAGGEANGWQGLGQLEAGGELPQAGLPAESAWLGLTPRAGDINACVDVIVPVYKGRAETLRCLHSVLAADCDLQFELIVIDDASPDAELAAEIRGLAERGLFTLHVNPVNKGFVHTVNRGMALHPERDVVLLNADAEVYDGWLDRLDAAAKRDARTATVTPLSNNATICSYPRFLHDNPYPLELPYEALDKLAAEVNAGGGVEAPTGVGFCMYIKRACLNELGLFDEKRFGKGYGEENDFCQRALKKGWRNIIAADVFVRHWGSASFQGERGKRVERALRALDRLHPNYQRDVHDFIAQDPLAPFRERLDLARLRRMAREQNVLIVCHGRGGGAERHVQEDVARLLGEGRGVFLLRPQPGRKSHVVVQPPCSGNMPNIAPVALEETEALGQLLEELRIREVHTHGLVDFEASAPYHLVALTQRLAARLEVNLHDYKVICPRINLVDSAGYYCGEPSPAGCNHCLKERGSDFGVFDISSWRKMHHEVLTVADSVLAPDQDVVERVQRYYPDVVIEVSPHETVAEITGGMRQITLQPSEKLRIVVIGAISKIKGYEVLLACAREAAKRRLPIEFIVLGYSLNDRKLEEAGVKVTGRYLEHEALERLEALQPHIAWFPALWPETYSYTLSLALMAGLPVVAFDIGAIARRLRKLDRAEGLLPLHSAKDARKLTTYFLNRQRAMSTETTASA